MNLKELDEALSRNDKSCTLWGKISDKIKPLLSEVSEEPIVLLTLRRVYFERLYHYGIQIKDGNELNLFLKEEEDATIGLINITKDLIYSSSTCPSNSIEQIFPKL